MLRHDGEKFTAEDVTTHDYWLQKLPHQLPAPCERDAVVESAEALDATTVRLTCEQPFAPRCTRTPPISRPLPQHIWRRGPQTATLISQAMRCQRST